MKLMIAVLALCAWAAPAQSITYEVPFDQTEPPTVWEEQVGRGLTPTPGPFINRARWTPVYPPGTPTPVPAPGQPVTSHWITLIEGLPGSTFMLRACTRTGICSTNWSNPQTLPTPAPDEPIDALPIDLPGPTSTPVRPSAPVLGVPHVH